VLALQFGVPQAPWKLPRKTREIQTAVVDSTRWNGFPFRDDDIVVATYAKTGTTWTQQIVGELVFRGEQDAIFASECSPWLDFRPIPLDEVLQRLQAQQHRRFVKTHLPIDALVFHSQAKYVYIARDGRDTLWSLYNHHAGFTAQAYQMINGASGRIGPPLEPPASDIVQYYHQWLDGGGLDLGSNFWEHVQGWWDARHLPNVLLLHFNDLKTDLAGQMRRIAAFLDIEIEEQLWPTLVEHCTFDYMRSHASSKPSLLDMVFNEGAKTFFNKGTNGRWKDVLSAADIEKYERLTRERLTPECAHWVATGERGE
jgi:aryl sulfotransferase